MKYNDITGLRFDRLTVLSLHSRSQSNMFKWLCRCDCGNETVVFGKNLKKGHVRSCGCFREEVRGKASITHGMCATPEYSSWQKMKSRCLNKDYKRYAEWGGRGITVCPEWISSFEAFYRDMGPRPSPSHTLDRIDNDRGYEPGNCRWATPHEQSANRSNAIFLTFRGETRPFEEWVRVLGIKKTTLWQRIFRYGWSIEDAFTLPIRQDGKRGDHITPPQIPPRGAVFLQPERS